jgi:hypothetical protein
VDTVDTAQPLLRRLTGLTLSCSSVAGTAATLGRAVSHLLTVTELTLSDLTAAHAAQLQSYTHSTEGCVNLRMYFAEGQSYSLDLFILQATATNSYRFEQLRVAGMECVTEATLLVLAARCPSVQLVDLDIEVTEQVLLQLVQHWPRLTDVRFGKNTAFTDAVLDAIAEHCALFTYLDLSENTLVTEGAIVRLVQRCRQIEFVTCPVSFTPEAEERVNSVLRMALNYIRQPVSGAL